MKKVILFCLVLLCYSALGNAEPEGFQKHPPPIVTLTIPATNYTVFNGETLRIPLTMDYQHLRRFKVWSYQINHPVRLENISGKCPAIVNDQETLHSGQCRMSIVIEGKGLGKIINGQIHYRVYGITSDTDWDKPFHSPYFTVKVIPHGLSMAGVQEQKATAGTNFTYPLKRAVVYYNENVKAYGPVALLMPDKDKADLNKLGLTFDQATFSIKGAPNKIGLHTFRIAAKNAHSTADYTQLKINVIENQQNKPQFKPNHDIYSAAPLKKYSLNLMSLLQPNKSFENTNQVTFRLSKNHPLPEWLDPPYENFTVLKGTPPAELAGRISPVTLIASSNTGGDSKAETINIPIAIDPALKPTIKPFEMEHLAGSQFYTDIATYIEDPMHDKDLKVIINKVEIENPFSISDLNPNEKIIPEIPKLHFSSNSPTGLEGVIPSDATGYKYLITLRASNIAGGTSDPIIIPLKVSINTRKTPQFKGANPHLPILFPGQDYYYNFVANRDVFPEYEDAPYEIQFAEDSEHPNWLKLENNKLTASGKDIPNDLEPTVTLELIITNIPGGTSEKITLDMLTAAN